ncbi:Chaperone protein dnaJ 72 [Apostasia shenzhenica]|uniref:Chaperone protein dnaJ 72 n=1 Tax=Apostasia shenzhenica TaxID=1088818 RepID=A0A2I0BCW2_9ASPA|nr:Chaperone protein dnaJ 72 [Apostasia shenzhenica]
MDYYRTLGLSIDATKEEIKEAYRRSALDYHPDRHTQSSGEIRDRAALRFKQASEAYQVLVDDRKRADYDVSRHRGGGFGGWSSGASSGPAGPGYSGRGYGYGGGGGVDHARRSTGGMGSTFDLGALFKFMNTHGFLMSIAFASLLIGGAVLGDRSVEKLWKINNMGKSFEEAMVSIEKVRVQKENNIEVQRRT